ncbi:MAG: hypothetical protein H7256_07800 [Bdellovibrio sp.]|nr:hypothetical protein [Bdellovibrio sp.]
MKSTLASIVLGLSLFGSTGFAETRIYTWIPAQLIMDGLKEVGLQFSDCSPSKYCSLVATNITCTSKVTAKALTLDCSLTDTANGKVITKSSNDVTAKNLKLDLALSSLGYKTQASQYSVSSVLEKINCSTQITGENAICYVTEADRQPVKF